jgi:ABC-type multidrug transport system fused ATPase/permease subunit
MPLRHTLPAFLRLLHAEADRTIRLHLLAALLLVIAGGVLAALAPLALKAMVDAVAGPAPDHNAANPDALRWGAAYLLALFGARVLADIRPLVTGRADQRLYTRLTRRFFRHLLSLPLAYLLRRRSGELLHSLDLATTGCQLVIGHVVNSILPVLVETAVMAVVLIQLGQPALVATFGLTAFAYLGVFGASSGNLIKRAHGVSGASLELHALLADHLQCSEPLKCLAAEEPAHRRIDTATATLESRWLHLNRLRTRIGLGVTAIFTLSLGASLLLAGEAVADGTLSLGGFVLANVYMLQMVRPLEVLGSAARDLSQSLGFVRPLLDILHERPEDTPPDLPTAASRDDEAPAPRHGPALRLENVHFAYDPGRPVIKGLDLDVPRGGSVGIVGASGSGKSSLARLLLRLYSPQSGSILLDGQPVTTLSIADLRGSIGFVSQDTTLLHDTIAGNISLGRPGVSREQIERAAQCAQLHDFIAALPAGYDTQVGERGLHLSGGERQRLAIARAVLMQPGLYIFDEATSMLDSRTEGALLQSLHAHTAGCTTITIAHRLSTVMHADEIIVLDDGRIAERGRHATLLARGGLYARLWQRQLDCSTSSLSPNPTMLAWHTGLACRSAKRQRKRGPS